MTKYLLITIFCALVFSGCDDSTPAVGGSSDPDTTVTADDAGTEADVTPVDQGESSVDMGETAVAAPAFVEATLSPRRALYTLSDTPEVRVIVYDRIGRVIPNAPVDIDVQPAGRAEVGEARVVRFLTEGAGAVRACATPDICGRASFFVDDAPPSLTIDSPDRGELVTGEQEIRVVGHTDADPNVRVFVNDIPVETDDAGRFEYVFRARFGLNRIDVVADDGVRRPATRSVREVVWSPTVIPVPNGPLQIDDIAILRLDQRLMDSNEEPPAVDPDGVQHVSDLAGTIQVLLERSDLMGLLDDVQVADSANFSLRIEDVRPGQPDPTLLLTNSGLEVFLRLEGVEMDTTGRVELEGEQLDLAGRVSVDIAGFGSLRFVIAEDGSPGFVVENVGLAVENLSSEMQDSTAQAILDTVGSLVRSALNQVAEQFMGTLIEDELPNFIGLGIDDILNPLRRIEIDEEADGFIPAINVIVGLRADRPTFVRRDRFEIILDGEVTSDQVAEAPHPIEGIPAFATDSTPVWPAQSIGVLAVRLLTLNAVTQSIWRQGALQLDLSDMVGGLLPQIERVWLDARLPPLVVPAPIGSPKTLELQIGEIDVFVQNPANPEPDRYVMSLRSGLSIGIENGSLRSTVDDQLDVRVELVDRGGEEPPLDPTLFATIAQTQLGEALTESLTNLIRVDIPAIELQVDAFQRFAPSVQSVGVTPSFPEQLSAQNGWLVLPATGDIQIRTQP